jgi:hypothetical protein
MATWLKVMEQLLTAMDTHDWNVDLSKQYFMRGEKLLYGWRVIFQGEEVAQHLDEIAKIVMSAPLAQKQLDEVPLGASPDRNALRAGKGAQPLNKAVVGPLALKTLPTGG